MATIAEKRAALAELERLMLGDLGAMWRAAGLADDFAAWVIDAFPELVAQYGSIAGDLAAEWYEESAPALAYRATAAPLPSLEKWATSASWALNVGDGLSSLDLLGGTAQRGMFDQYRMTIITNAEAEGASYARHASANACPWCRMLATRGAVYGSKEKAERVGGRGTDVLTNVGRTRGRQAKGVRARGKQSIGDKYHDNCHCIAVEVRPGQTYEPPPYVEKWSEEYWAATEIARKKSRIVSASRRYGVQVDLAGVGAGDTKDILRIMREGPASRTEAEWLDVLK